MRFDLKYVFGIPFIIAFLSCNNEGKTNNWYKVEFKSLCNENDPPVASYEVESKHNRDTPYDLEISDSSEFKLISFKFLAECCLEFSGTANIKHDTLKLKYWDTKETAPCECICDYQLTYKLTRYRDRWKKVSVKKTTK